MVAGRIVSFIFVVITGISVFSWISVAKKGKIPELRRIAGFDAIEEAVGRATELGRPVLFTPGKGDVADITGPQLLAGMDLLSHVAQLTARNGAQLIATIPTATVQPIAEDIIRASYLKEGKPDQYSQDMVRFVSPEQMAYAVATAGVILREKVAATFLVGPFFGESPFGLPRSSCSSCLPRPREASRSGYVIVFNSSPR